VHDALATLPWVEKKSVRVSFGQKLATFTATDPKKFDMTKVQGALNEAGEQYKASVVKTGSHIPAEPAKEKGAK
jgi:hypothetical protein